MTALVSLICSNNLISSLPDDFGQLVALEELYLAHNELGIFPASVVKLTHLRVCDVSFNTLRELPDKVRCTYGAARAFRESAHALTRRTRRRRTRRWGRGRSCRNCASASIASRIFLAHLAPGSVSKRWMRTTT